MVRCYDCDYCIFCKIWTEVKCLKKETRVPYGLSEEHECKNFKKKSDKNDDLGTCHCKDCMENPEEE